MRNDNKIFDIGYINKELEKNPFTNVSKIVSGAIEDAILTMRLKPGEKLIISSIASQLGISTTPVREAIDRLLGQRIIKKKNKENRIKYLKLRCRKLKICFLSEKR